ncbi:hypothetical protein ACHAQJ_008309 [Trichoderma viride]
MEPETGQARTGDTNEYTASEQEAMLRYFGLFKKPEAGQARTGDTEKEATPQHMGIPKEPETGDTNEYTVSEQEAMLRHFGLLKESDSEKANYNTSSDLARIARILAGDDVEDDSQVQPSEIIRATLEPVQGSTLNLDVLSIGTSEEKAPPQSPTAFVEKVSLAQSHQEIGYNIQVATLPQDLEGRDDTSSSEAFLLQLFFDPTSDRIVFVNMAKQPRITIQALVPSQQHVGLTPSAEPAVIEYLYRAILEVGSWIIGLGDQHRLKLTVIPRGYVSITPKAWNETKNPAKRMLELSQPETPTIKRGKTEKMEGEPNAPAAFQPTPARPGPTLVNKSSPENVSDMRHPLEWLRVGDAANVVGVRGEDYTLIRSDDIAVKDGTLVFKAHHSSYSGKLVVVKVFRTTSDPAQDARSLETMRCAKSWMKEARNHFKVSQHSAVARLYEIDGRFLSMYMEHVDSPDLSFYRERNINPFCTLTTGDAERVLRDMSNALQYIHNKNVHHNDIKPGNILFSKKRGAVLIDFGVSTDDGSVHVGGSPWYVPPEFDKKTLRGAAGDVFALGVVMLFLLRRIPFPELRRPRLMWIIADLKKTGPLADRARQIMTKWLDIVEKTSDELERASDELEHASDEFINATVAAMTKSEVEQRITVNEIVEALQN